MRVFNRVRLAICAHDVEWRAAKALRMQYFFDPLGIEDPYVWTFNHKDHLHFVLYKGVEVMGYAHVQLWSEGRAAVRMIAIDAMEQRKGYGRELMELIEKWLRMNGCRCVHVESREGALAFYKALGYRPMAFDDPDGYESDPSDIGMGKVLARA